MDTTRLPTNLFFFLQPSFPSPLFETSCTHLQSFLHASSKLLAHIFKAEHCKYNPLLKHYHASYHTLHVFRTLLPVCHHHHQLPTNHQHTLLLAHILHRVANNTSLEIQRAQIVSRLQVSNSHPSIQVQPRHPCPSTPLSSPTNTTCLLRQDSRLNTLHAQNYLTSLSFGSDPYLHLRLIHFLGNY